MRSWLVPATLVAGLFMPAPAFADEATDAPVARYAGTTMTEAMLEAFVAELPADMKTYPRENREAWREQTARLLAARDLLASSALARNPAAEDSIASETRRFEEGYLAYLYLRDKVYHRVHLEESEIRAFCESHPQDFGTTAQVYVRVMKLADRTSADNAVARLAKEPFDKVERDMSELSARTRGKVLGPFPSQGGLERLPDPLFLAALVLEPGAVSPPVKLGDDWYLVKLERRDDSAALQFEAVRDRVLEWLEAEKVQQLEKDLLTRLGAQETSSTSSPDSRSTSGSRTALAARAARKEGYTSSPDFVAAAALFRLQRLSEAEQMRLVQTMLRDVTDDQVTSYLAALKAVKGRDGYSDYQKSKARAQMETERLGEAQQRIQDDLLTSASFEMVHESSGASTVGEELQKLESDTETTASGRLCLLSSRDRGEVAPPSGPMRFGGVSHLLPNPYFHPSHLGRSADWTVQREPAEGTTSSPIVVEWAPSKP